MTILYIALITNNIQGLICGAGPHSLPSILLLIIIRVFTVSSSRINSLKYFRLNQIFRNQSSILTRLIKDSYWDNLIPEKYFAGNRSEFRLWRKIENTQLSRYQIWNSLLSFLSQIFTISDFSSEFVQTFQICSCSKLCFSRRWYCNFREKLKQTC